MSKVCTLFLECEKMLVTPEVKRYIARFEHYYSKVVWKRTKQKN